MSSVYNITRKETDKSGSRNVEITLTCCQSEDSSGLLCYGVGSRQKGRSGKLPAALQYVVLHLPRKLLTTLIKRKF